MYIESITLTNFRNYESLELGFSDKTNILYGENAQGKTNVLEAAYVGATTRSHRMARDKDMIRFGAEEAHIRLNVKKRNVGHRIDMQLRKTNGKTVNIDGLPIRRSSELFGLINIIFFSPEDLSIVKEGPAERRRFMDSEICQLSRIYYSNLADYNKVLNQRNNLLREILSRRSRHSSCEELLETLDIWDMQLVQYGKRIIEERQNFIHMLYEVVERVHEKITGGREKVELRYEPSVSADRLEEQLKARRESDLRYAATSVGPQRDDIGIYINENDVRVFGSQGQQRTAALTLKLAEIELVKEMISDTPILLLDDVMSELDERRRDALLGSIDGIQTIITCTGYGDFIRERMQQDRVYQVIQGKITETKA
ncbi:MAG: DNA replication/repair protein RecF [Eubacterium sp.]|nr:DNA replication/repair protein RecF [Eubacterium sp.]